MAVVSSAEAGGRGVQKAPVKKHRGFEGLRYKGLPIVEAWAAHGQERFVQVPSELSSIPNALNMAPF